MRIEHFRLSDYCAHDGLHPRRWSLRIVFSIGDIAHDFLRAFDDNGKFQHDCCLVPLLFCQLWQLELTSLSRTGECEGDGAHHTRGMIRKRTCCMYSA
jgi:hypothetical protein